MSEINETTTTAVDGQDLVAQILNNGRFLRANAELARSQEEKKHAHSLLNALAGQYLDRKHVMDQKTLDAINVIKALIADIDAGIGRQLDAILHHSSFQSLEARWRGLHYLVMNSETNTTLKIRVLNVSKKDLAKDLETAVEFDRSTLFKKLYEDEYGTYGGEPFGLLVGDYEFDGSNPDVDMLEQMSGVAAAAHAPFIGAASPELFDMEGFTTLDVPGDLAKVFETTRLTRWRKFRELEDSRYVALALPRVLLRVPYGAKTAPVDGFTYEENTGAIHGNYLWGNAAYALAQRITNAFSLYHWCAAIRGVEGGGLVEGLPFYTFASAGEEVIKCPTEIAISDRRENELSELGFIPLCYKKNSNQAAFFGGSTLNKPVTYNLASANSNARLSAQLPYILAASRFAHYIKVMMRDKVGAFLSREAIANYLNNWIADYVLLNDTAGQDSKARLPLREARVDVTEIPGKPGCYRAVAFLRPHFQLNELTVSMRLVAELPAPATG